VQNRLWPPVRNIFKTKTKALAAAWRSARTQHPQGWWLAALLYGLLGVLILGPQPWLPVVGAGDTDLWEAMGFYVREHWHWWPLPHIDLVSDRAFYPYGGQVALQAWGLERDLFYALLFSLGGAGPWLKLYFLLSVAIALFGIARILQPDFGERRAILTAIGAVFLNIYALICKFPFHSNMAIVHWLGLSLATDFVLVWRFVRGRAIGRAWWLGRGALVLLSLGQDLGYVAGFGLLSLVLSGGWMLAVRWWRWRTQAIELAADAHQDAKNQDWQLRLGYWIYGWPPFRPIEWGLIALIIWAAWLYLLPVIPIVQLAKELDWSNTFDRAWFAHPLRLLAPYWPQINPIAAAGWWRAVLPSPLETDFDGVVGWGLLLAGAIGCWQRRRWWAAFVPLGLLMGCLIAYRPWDLPILQWFPWFSFNRVAGRGTVVFPIALALCSLGWQPDAGRSARTRQWNRWAALAVAGICLLDLIGGYGLKPRAQPLDPSFQPYMALVAQQPGTAVLDWPFCVTGGNGVGSGDGTCPFFAHHPSTHALSRFHHKATVGQYLGRLHPSQLTPYLEAGWQYLALPDHPDLNQTQRQRRCFRRDEWEFFRRFFQLGDFAGINLYVDRLARGCEKEFYAQLGHPIAQTTVPGMGRVVFIPKPAPWQGLVDLDQARLLRFSPFLDPAPVSPDPANRDRLDPEAAPLKTAVPELDLVQFGTVRGVEIRGGLDRNRQGQRWGLAPMTVLDLQSDRSQTRQLKIQATVPVTNQQLSIFLDDQLLWRSELLSRNQALDLNLPIALPAGKSQLCLVYEQSIILRDQIPAAGNRPIALTFQHLAIE